MRATFQLSQSQFKLNGCWSRLQNSDSGRINTVDAVGMKVTLFITWRF